MDLSKIETHLQKVIYPELEKGRPDWDKPHTEAVVYHMRHLMSNIEKAINKEVLLIAAYAHDWGYVDLFEEGKPLSNKDISGSKTEHMIKGAEKVKELLEDNFFNFLTEKQKQRISHLVFVHDKLDLLKKTDELLLMEADTLGGLDVNFIKPTFDEKSNERYMQEVKRKRFKLFISKYGKKQFQTLYKLRENYYKDNR
ncbi:HD domain-containing protein [Candidatus Woesebacteria bacterium]|nr:HD domain-containing protein [Candidatus Woesebacteria bacterium]